MTYKSDTFQHFVKTKMSIEPVVPGEQENPVQLVESAPVVALVVVVVVVVVVVAVAVVAGPDRLEAARQVSHTKERETGKVKKQENWQNTQH